MCHHRTYGESVRPPHLPRVHPEPAPGARRTGFARIRRHQKRDSDSEKF